MYENPSPYIPHCYNTCVNAYTSVFCLYAYAGDRAGAEDDLRADYQDPPPLTRHVASSINDSAVSYS